jgi:hypothetical protein
MQRKNRVFLSGLPLGSSGHRFGFWVTGLRVIVWVAAHRSRLTGNRSWNRRTWRIGPLSGRISLLPRRVSHSRILSLPISRSLSLTLSISPPFSLSRLSISRISLSLDLSSQSHSLSLSLFSGNRTEKKQRRKKEE